MLARELEMALKFIINNNEKKEKAKISLNIELNWLLLFISIFVKLNPQQNIFSNIYNPKVYVKKIRENDAYLGYLSYAIYYSIIDSEFNPENILIEIIEKYPKRVEGLLFYWSYLTKSSVRDYQKALILSEIFLKNLPQYHFENDIY